MIFVSLLICAAISFVIEKGRGYMERIDSFSLEELDPETRQKLKNQYYKKKKERDQESN
jgi:hypothetical protein